MGDISAWLTDVLASIKEIEEDLPETNNFFLYQENRTAKRAVERNLEIIGEAMNRILKHDPDVAITHAKKIVNLRNRIIHGYDNISDEIIYTIATRDIPKLKKEVLEIIG